MEPTSRALAQRLLALEDDAGLRRVERLRWVFQGFGVALCVALVLAIRVGAPTWSVAALAAALGWTIAEASALRNRVRQWPLYRRYIDWPRVKADAQG